MIQEYRSAMFIPGSSEKMLEKAAGLNADLILFDLEDSVLRQNKEIARVLVASKIQELKADKNFREKGRALGVRINDLSSGYSLADIKAVLPSKPDLIVLPKVESGDDLNKIDAMLTEAETQSASIKLIVLAAETPKSLFQLDSIENVSNRLTGISWGAEDLASELGAAKGRDDSGAWLAPLQLAQSLCLAKARDLGVQPLDTVYPDVKNTEGLRNECLTAKQMGYSGKLAIHPAQIEIINEVFSSSKEELEYAKRLIKLFAANPNKGALQMDGKMVDIPHLRAAERLLAKNRIFTD